MTDLHVVMELYLCDFAAMCEHSTKPLTNKLCQYFIGKDGIRRDFISHDWETVLHPVSPPIKGVYQQLHATQRELLLCLAEATLKAVEKKWSDEEGSFHYTKLVDARLKTGECSVYALSSDNKDYCVSVNPANRPDACYTEVNTSHLHAALFLICMAV
jgi:hypothetical protein